MSTVTSKETSVETVTKNGVTVETATTVEKTTEPSGKTTKVTTVVETTTNPDGSKSKKTTISTEVYEGNPTDNGNDNEIVERDLKEIKFDDEEKKNIEEFLRLSNEHRQQNGKDPLRLDDTICALAKEHNDLMVSGKKKLSHDGFSNRARRIENSMANAENVCCCSDQEEPLKVLLNQFVNDPNNNKNLLGDYNTVGISVGKDSKGVWFLTQLFASIK